MSATAVLFAILAAWLLIGIGCSYVMARRGHDAWSWGALGAVFGPLVVPLALNATRRESRAAGFTRTLRVGRPGPGPVSVLVGIDGSPESRAAAIGVVDLLGSRLGRLTLATVIDYDAADAHDRVLEGEVERLLDAAAAAVSAAQPNTVVLAGKPTEALLRFARDHGIDLVAVGSRGRGVSRAVLGSVASAFARQHEVLVLIAGHTPTGIAANP